MVLPVTARLQLSPDLSICPVLNGMWQVSGAHGLIDKEAALTAMLRLHDAGFVTWDLADHYGPAEDFIGEFRRRMRNARGDDALMGIQAFTKWVPQPGRVTRQAVEAAIGRSLRRMDVERLDILQFHWWDYEDESYLDALSFLDEMRQRGLIRHLSLTNFDTVHMQRILDHGISITSNQVQYSLVDRRPRVAMEAFCRDHDIRLLTYGTVCGGLLSDRYLDKPEPRSHELNTASLHKYKQMIDVWGGWQLFQELLRAVKDVAGRRAVSMANVAVRYILDEPAVGGVILGVRLGTSDHLEDNARVFDFAHEPPDREQIDAVLSKGRDLFRLIGDCGDEYRR